MNIQVVKLIHLIDNNEYSSAAVGDIYDTENIGYYSDILDYIPRRNSIQMNNSNTDVSVYS